MAGIYNLMKINMKAFLHIVVLLAMASAGASPACKFVSGENTALIEICASDGNIKTVRVPASQSPVKQKDTSHKAQNDCAFCFAQAHLSKITAASVLVTYQATENASLVFKSVQAQHLDLKARYNPRAPPRLS